MKEIELEEYCKYCGEDNKKGHSKNCPLVYGIKTNKDGYIVFGFKTDPYNRELNLHTARMGTLFALKEDGIGPTDKKVGGRLAYEHLKFEVEQNVMHISNLINQKNESFNPIKKFIIQRKINELEQKKEQLKRLGELYLEKYGKDFFNLKNLKI